jgi:serine/threonine protein kinase
VNDPRTATTRTESPLARFRALRPALEDQRWLDAERAAALERRIQEAGEAAFGGGSLLGWLMRENVLTAAQAQEIEHIERIAGHFPGFALMRKIGAGGMGTVYLARHRASEQLVALKTINARLAEDGDFISRFERETKALSGISHPHIAGLIACGETAGHFYLAMEYIDGPSLIALLREHQVLPELYCLRMCRQIAEGLAHVWTQAKLVHRDIKPENILVLRQGDGDELFSMEDVAKLIDFGLVKSNEEEKDQRLTQTGMTIGTPLYMSPEQIRGEVLDCRSDIYGLGATLYHLLTGRTPYIAGSSGAIMSMHLTQPIPDPGAAVPSISQRTRNLVRMCLAKKPGDRFHTFDALIKELDNALSEQGERAATSVRFLRKPLVLKQPTRRPPSPPTPRPPDPPLPPLPLSAPPRPADGSRHDSPPRPTPAVTPEQVLDDSTPISSRIMRKHRRAKGLEQHDDPSQNRVLRALADPATNDAEEEPAAAEGQQPPSSNHLRSAVYDEDPRQSPGVGLTPWLLAVLALVSLFAVWWWFGRT